MKLDLNKLENVHRRGDKIVAACPSCREGGGDSKGKHLAIFPDGRFACAANQGDKIHAIQILELAGLSGYQEPRSSSAKTEKIVDWQSDGHRLLSDMPTVARIAHWRQWAAEFVETLARRGVLGVYGGRPCFPVRLDSGRGQVVGRHVFAWPEERQSEGGGKANAWYSPPGVKPLPPLLINWKSEPTLVAVFESQWDALSVLLALGDQCPPMLVTRGTSPTDALSNALRGVESVVFWMQRDQPKQDGTLPCEQWLTRCRNLLPASVESVRRIDPPEVFKDWNDVLRSMGLEAFAQTAASASQAGVGIEPPSKPARSEVHVPQPLPDALPPVQPFDVQRLLPPLLRRYVVDCADRLQVDPGFVAVPLIVSLGSVMGNRLCLRPKLQDDWGEYPNVWGAIVGRPSTLKSPSLTEGMRALQSLQDAANRTYTQEMADYRKQVAANEIMRTAAKAEAVKSAKKGLSFDAALLVDDDRDDAPFCRRFITSDAGPEALHQVLSQPVNAHGILCFQDELTGILARMADQERGAALRAFMLSGWNGSQSFVVDRIGRGQNIRVDRCCISVMGGIQPGKLAPLVDGAVRESIDDDGWIQRLGLLIWPDPIREYRAVDRKPDIEAFDAVMGLFEALEGSAGRDFPGATFDENRQQHFLRLAPEASVKFIAWLEDETRTLRRGDFSAAIESHFMKMRKTVLSLALIFHVVAEWDSTDVSVDCLNRALMWCGYLKSHALRVYGSSRSSCASTARRILQKLQGKDLSSPFTARDLKRRAWSGLTDPKTVDAAIEMLLDHGWLQAVERETQGRWTTDYTAHVLIFKTGTDFTAETVKSPFGGFGSGVPGQF